MSDVTEAIKYCKLQAGHVTGHSMMPCQYKSGKQRLWCSCHIRGEENHFKYTVPRGQRCPGQLSGLSDVIDASLSGRIHGQD